MGSVILLFVLLALLGAIFEKKSANSAKVITFISKNQFAFLIISAILTIVHFMTVEKMAIMGSVTFLLILLATVNSYLAKKEKAFIPNYILLILIVVSTIIHVITL